MEKTHKTVFKHTKEFEKALQTPVRPFLTADTRDWMTEADEEGIWDKVPVRQLRVEKFVAPEALKVRVAEFFVLCCQAERNSVLLTSCVSPSVSVTFRRIVSGRFRRGILPSKAAKTVCQDASVEQKSDAEMALRRAERECGRADWRNHQRHEGAANGRCDAGIDS